MVGTIITAVAYNLVAVFILISGIFSAVRDGVKITLIKLFLTLCGGVGAYFLTPYISKKIYKISWISTALKGKVSQSTINGCLFLFWFLIFYVIVLMICSIIRYCNIKKLRNKKLNKLKMKRAKSINPSAERAAKRAEWRALKLKYTERKRWYHRLFSCIIGMILSVVVGYMVLLPFGYISKDMKKPYLIKGYKYTLNGVIGEKIPDFLIDVKNEITSPEEDKTPSVEPEVEVPDESVDSSSYPEEIIDSVESVDSSEVIESVEETVSSLE